MPSRLVGVAVAGRAAHEAISRCQIGDIPNSAASQFQTH
jgi:hypothetical protein